MEENEKVMGETGVVGKGTGNTVDYSGPKVVREDPVFKKDGKWFYWDETWGNNYGPFDTEEIARQKLARYIEIMG